MRTNPVNRREFLRITGMLAASLAPISSFPVEGRKARVTLLGDSIRLGYQPFVQQHLQDEAEVWGPEANTQHTVNLVANLSTWIQKRPVDIVHLNSGLHDIKNIPYNSRSTLVSKEVYGEYIERTIRYIHQFWPECVVIWATTTPVIDEKANSRHLESNDFSRYNEDVIRYNEISSGIAGRMGIPVNDLYGFVMEGSRDTIMKEDGIHFTDLGSRLLAEKVADAVRVFL